MSPPTLLRPIHAGTCFVVWALLVLVAGVGCRSTPAAPTAAAAIPRPQATPEPYRLAPGDVIDLKFYYNTDLNESVPIRPDGAIGLQLIGEVRAAGKTAEELRAELRERYSEHLKRPEVAVIVRDFASQLVYVGGEVQSPGLIEMHGPLSALQAIFARGGAKPSAHLGQVVLIRYVGDGVATAREIDMDEAMAGNAPDVFLRPFDVVYIPKTPIATLAHYVDQYINEIVPRSVSFPFIYEIRSDNEFR